MGEMPATLGQAVSAFIAINLFSLIVHGVIMIRTGAKNETRLAVLETNMKEVSGDVDLLKTQMAAITGTAGGINYRGGK